MTRTRNYLRTLALTLAVALAATPAVAGGTDVYFFNLPGLSVDGATTFQSVFSSPGGGHNLALLYGRLTTTPVPEPASLLLFGSALMAIAMRMRRARAVSAERA